MPTFPFNLYGLAAIAAWIATAASLPLWRAWCLRHNHVDDPGHRKIHQEPVPLAGGLALLTGLAIPLLFAGVLLATGTIRSLSHPETSHFLLDPGTAERLLYGYERRALQLAAILAGAVGMVLLGWLDDRFELRPATKFAGQLLVAGVVAASGVRITLFVDNPAFSYGVTVLWILTVTNACNFMDNMNGLCTGLGLIGSWCFAWTGAVQGQYLVAAIGFLTCGALFGFLPYNYPRASAFLGDAGSHLIGYLLAVLAILPHFYSAQSPTPAAVLKPLLILGVILGDLVCVVWIRWRLGKPFYIGDTNHLSHRLVRGGLDRSTAVACIWLAAATLGFLAFLL